MSAEENLAKSIEQLEELGVDVNTDLIEAIIKGLGIANTNADASMVSCTDPEEMDRVVKNFAMKKLGMDQDAAEAVVAEVGEKMSSIRMKKRGAFYYLVTVASGKESVYLG